MTLITLRDSLQVKVDESITEIEAEILEHISGRNNRNKASNGSSLTDDFINPATTGFITLTLTEEKHEVKLAIEHIISIV